MSAIMILGQRDWFCVEASVGGAQKSEQWCLRGEMPSRASTLLLRSRSIGPYPAPASTYPEAIANIVAERSFVRPALNVLHSSYQTAAWLLALSGDVLMGDRWELRLVHQANNVTTVCTLEVYEHVPREFDSALLELLIALVSAPDGFVEPQLSRSLNEVEAAIATALQMAYTASLQEWMSALQRATCVAEELPPSLEANFCIGKLAEQMSGVKGAAFLGLSEESVRLNRIILRRTPRAAHPGLWAFSIRGALLSLAAVSTADEIPNLVTACRAAIAKPNLIPLESAVLHHCEGELLLGTSKGEEAAASAFSQSCEGARQLGDSGKSHLLMAALGLAKAYKALGRSADEINALITALPLADTSAQGEIQTRLDELKQPHARRDEAWRNERWVEETERYFAQEQHKLDSKRQGRVLLKSPFTVDRPIQALVLRPLVTANSSWVPNRFTNPLVHAWRFRDEPATLTFEETLSRALGNQCSFMSKGGDEEGFGIGRVGLLPSEEAAKPDEWKNLVEFAVGDDMLTDLIIVYPSDSPGMQWELDLLSRRPPEKQVRVFMVPPSLDDDGRKRCQAAQRALFSRGVEMPNWHDDGLIFHCGAEGKLLWSETFTMLWEGRFATWVQRAISLARTLRQD